MVEKYQNAIKEARESLEAERYLEIFDKCSPIREKIEESGEDSLDKEVLYEFYRLTACGYVGIITNEDRREEQIFFFAKKAIEYAQNGEEYLAIGEEICEHYYKQCSKIFRALLNRSTRESDLEWVRDPIHAILKCLDFCTHMILQVATAPKNFEVPEGKEYSFITPKQSVLDEIKRDAYFERAKEVYDEAGSLCDNFPLYVFAVSEHAFRCYKIAMILFTLSYNFEKLTKDDLERLKWAIGVRADFLAAKCVRADSSILSFATGVERRETINEIRELESAIKRFEPNYTAPAFDEEGVDTGTSASSGGCYVATAVYGSYDCPQVWTLRRYRDFTLAKSWYGRAFIRAYYAISPTLVKWFGNTTWFKKMWQGKLDCMVAKLQEQGIESTPYEDRKW